MPSLEVQLVFFFSSVCRRVARSFFNIFFISPTTTYTGEGASEDGGGETKKLLTINVNNEFVSLLILGKNRQERDQR